MDCVARPRCKPYRRGRPRIFEWAQEKGAIILTFDEDFADARMYPVGSHAGVIRLRVWPTTIEQVEYALSTG
jgi:predicted nuclease of predicted toxin-antitoxin system